MPIVKAKSERIKNGAMDFEALRRFITEKMRMSEVYQPLVIRTLIENGGSASTRQLALAALPYDTSQVEYYEYRMKIHPKQTLRKHGIISYRRSNFVLSVDVSLLSEDQKRELTSLCDQKIQKFIDDKSTKQQKTKIPTHIGGLMRYEVLRRAKSRCALCGITRDERALDVDHIVPRSLGGKTEMSNLQALCYVCNRSKRNLDDTDFRNYIPPRMNSDCQLCCSDQSSLIQNTRAFALTEEENNPKENIIVVPKRHVGSFFDLDQKEVNDCYDLLRQQRNYLYEKYVDPNFEISVNERQIRDHNNFHTYIRLIPH